MRQNAPFRAHLSLRHVSGYSCTLISCSLIIWSFCQPLPANSSRSLRNPRQLGPTVSTFHYVETGHMKVILFMKQRGYICAKGKYMCILFTYKLKTTILNPPLLRAVTEDNKVSEYTLEKNRGKLLCMFIRSVHLPKTRINSKTRQYTDIVLKFDSPALSKYLTHALLPPYCSHCPH